MLKSLRALFRQALCTLNRGIHSTIVCYPMHGFQPIVFQYTFTMHLVIIPEVLLLPVLNRMYYIKLHNQGMNNICSDTC